MLRATAAQKYDWNMIYREGLINGRRGIKSRRVGTGTKIPGSGTDGLSDGICITFPV